jgi:hypothetical protein
MAALGIREGEAQDYLRSVGYEARPRGDPSVEVADWAAYPIGARSI